MPNGKIREFSLEVGGKTLTIETGKYAGQAHGSCTVRYGDTVILATAVMGTKPREGIDYFPLMVDFEERLYAAGKIKGSRFIKREGRPSDEAIITARLIDRSLRPLFQENERRDVQVTVTALCVDMENDSDIPGLIAASTALHLSKIPWGGPVAAARVGRIGGEWVLNPTYTARQKSELDAIVVGNADEVVMIEAEGQEVPEDILSEALEFGHRHLRKIIPLIEEVRTAVGQEKAARFAELPPEEQEREPKLRQKVHDFLAARLPSVFDQRGKQDYYAQLGTIETELDEMLKADNEVSKDERSRALTWVDGELDLAARKRVLSTDKRVDGRAIDELRPLSAEVGLLPRTHGSGLFQRGETQVLSIVTLGAPGDEQVLDSMEEDGKKRYMHHYNFPSYSVGEVKPNRGPGRREIGHGALAEKALEPVLPSKEQFPYTIRVVSEVLSSNGSSSQASTCGSSLALMDAGVPITAPVAGIAMGLITEPGNPANYRILTDIQGIEDHSGDMDFKVAGTAKGMTAVQMDIKLGGISLAICRETLAKAREARLKILEVMAQAISAPRPELSQYAPRIESLRIPVDKIRMVIGPGGKMINEIIDTCGVEIDIEDDGLVMVTSTNADGMQRAIQWVKDLTHEVKPGETFEGKVTRIMDFGAFVEVLPGQEGMVHISELAWHRVNTVEDVVKVGDKLPVVVTEIDSLGRMNLSHRQTTPKPEGYVEPERFGGNRHGGPSRGGPGGGRGFGGHGGGRRH